MPNPLAPDLIVTCALIRRGRQVLCAQRSEAMSLPLKWEFPGGKVEKGENAEECIIREIEEELNLTIKVNCRAPVVRHPYEEDAILELIPFVAEVSGGTMQLLEHAAARWCSPAELPALDWAEADVLVVKWWLEIGQNL
jgi:8-oxo-dGTP diphosphatase